MNQLKQEVQRLNKMRDAVQRRLRLVEDQKAETEQSREILKNQISSLEKGEHSLVLSGSSTVAT